jgi:integrase
MANLYKRARSPFWWIEYTDMTGDRRQESTKLRHDLAADTRKARELLRAMAAEEKTRLSNDERWNAWVVPYLKERYSDESKTLDRYLTCWRNLSAFLDVHRVFVPRQLTRQHVRDYVLKWRQERHAEVGCYEVSKNTALTEIKVLRILMYEAVQLGFATINPCEKLHIRPDKAPRKPRITDAEHEKIMAALRDEPEWMRISYIIAWEQGCRFSETSFPLSDVHLDRNVIGFRTKGQKASIAEFPLSPNLVPMFRKMKAEGRKITFEIPPMPGKAWWRFFRRLGLGHLCFHCTRVTFVTRCYERGIPKDAVMRLVGHSTYAAHEVYPRLAADHSTVQSMRELLDRRGRQTTSETETGESGQTPTGLPTDSAHA